MPIQAYLDESGGKGQSPVLVVAGWIGAAEDWALFSDDWAQCLSSAPRIGYFKMREAVSRANEFAGFRKEIRDKKLRDLARVIKKYSFPAYWLMIEMQAFEETIARAYLKPFNESYFWAFQETVLGIGADLASRGHKEQVDIIFDENNTFGPRAKLWYPLIRQEMSDRSIRSILPTEPRFENDEEALPLQAADLLAWNLNRSMLTPGNNPFHWLIEQELDPINCAGSSQVIDRRRMDSILQEAYRQLDPDLLDAYGFQDDPTG